MPAQKRAASASTTPRQRSDRQSAQSQSHSPAPATAKKSKYVEVDEDQEEEKELNGGAHSDAFEDSLSDSDSAKRRVKRKRTKEASPRASRRVTGAGTVAKAGKQTKATKASVGDRRNNRNGDKGDDDDGDDDGDDDEDSDDDSDDKLKVRILPLEQLRPLGGIEYASDRLHPNTLLFFKDLKANNKRPWLKAHDGEYRRALQDWNAYVDALTTRLVAADDTLPELPAKDLVFRIYRDTRFSHDPTPYKPNLSASWSRTGRKGPYAHYYLHCEPGSAFLAAGLFQPPAPALARLRASIDQRPACWRLALQDPALRRHFLAASPPGSAVAAFAHRNRNGALKTAPRDFSSDHPDIALLRLRSFVVRKPLVDAVFTAANGQQTIAGLVETAKVFVSFLNSVVMPDPVNVDDVGDDDDGDEDADNDNNDDAAQPAEEDAGDE